MAVRRLGLLASSGPKRRDLEKRLLLSNFFPKHCMGGVEPIGSARADL